MSNLCFLLTHLFLFVPKASIVLFVCMYYFSINLTKKLNSLYTSTVFLLLSELTETLGWLNLFKHQTKSDQETCLENYCWHCVTFLCFFFSFFNLVFLILWLTVWVKQFVSVIWENKEETTFAKEYTFWNPSKTCQNISWEPQVLQQQENDLFHHVWKKNSHLTLQKRLMFYSVTRQ